MLHFSAWSFTWSMYIVWDVWPVFWPHITLVCIFVVSVCVCATEKILILFHPSNVCYTQLLCRLLLCLTDKWSDQQDTMSSFQVVDSSPGSSVSIMETSNFAHVIFQNVGKSFLPQAPLECCYTLTPYIAPHPKDWVGIFKVHHTHTTAASKTSSSMIN